MHLNFSYSAFNLTDGAYAICKISDLNYIVTHVHTALDSFMLIDREIKSND